jgi:hypothetical protein
MDGPGILGWNGRFPLRSNRLDGTSRVVPAQLVTFFCLQLSSNIVLAGMGKMDNPVIPDHRLRSPHSIIAPIAKLPGAISGIEPVPPGAGKQPARDLAQDYQQVPEWVRQVFRVHCDQVIIK